MISNRSLLTISVLIIAGCRPSTAPTASKTPSDASPPAALRLLVIDDPDLAHVIERQWTAHGESPLQVRLTTQDEFLNKPERRLAADIVIYPSALIGELASRDWLQPLTEQQL